jgi:hypothetical protein
LDNLSIKLKYYLRQRKYGLGMFLVFTAICSAKEVRDSFRKSPFEYGRGCLGPPKKQEEDLFVGARYQAQLIRSGRILRIKYLPEHYPEAGENY